MSVSKWAYMPEKCDGDICVGDCDLCPKCWDGWESDEDGSEVQEVQKIRSNSWDEILHDLQI